MLEHKDTQRTQSESQSTCRTFFRLLVLFSHVGAANSQISSLSATAWIVVAIASVVAILLVSAVAFVIVRRRSQAPKETELTKYEAY